MNPEATENLSQPAIKIDGSPRRLCYSASGREIVRRLEELESISRQLAEAAAKWDPPETVNKGTLAELRRRARRFLEHEDPILAKIMTVEVRQENGRVGLVPTPSELVDEVRLEVKTDAGEWVEVDPEGVDG